MSKEKLPVFAQIEKRHIDFSIGQKFFPGAVFSEISYEDLPIKEVLHFEGLSKRFILPEEYRAREFNKILKITHDENDITYVARQTKTYSRTNEETEVLTYLNEVIDGENAGNSELRFNPASKDSFFKNKPFVEWNNSHESLMCTGLGTRRIYMMNALSKMFFNLPLYSSTLQSPEARHLWERLVKKGRAVKFAENAERFSRDRYVLTHQNPTYGEFDYTVVLTKEEVEETDKKVSNLLETVKVDSEGFVDFGEVCLQLMDKQTQYGSFYIEGIAGSPNLGSGLDFKNMDAPSYHEILIHKDSILPDRLKGRKFFNPDEVKK